MNQVIRKTAAIIVAVFGIGCCICFYPLRMFTTFSYFSEIEKEELSGTGDITEELTLEQEFLAPADYLKQINVYPQYLSERRTGELYLALYHSSGELLTKISVALADMPNYEWYPIVIDKPLTRGELYVYKIWSKGYGEKPPQLFASALSNAPRESKTYRYGGEVIPDTALGLQYEYFQKPDMPRQVYPYWALILLLSIITIEGILHFGGKGRA